MKDTSLHRSQILQICERCGAASAEFSGYVSESSSFCLFILPPHQERQKLEPFAIL